jgi:tripartite ATP-independent transporter DctM subunit
VTLIASITLLLVLFSLLALGVWIPFALMGSAAIAIAFFTDVPMGQVLAISLWGSSAKWSLTALPLFIWMGEILLRSRISDDLFTGVAPWLSRIPGRLVHVNVVASGIFAAVSGSSTATCATVGKITIPELKARGYNDGLAIGALAASGTLGLLLPPSIILIVYGVAVEESITRLFLAGIIPGVMMMLIFMAYIAGWSLFNPTKTPPPEPTMSLGQKIRQSKRLIPVIIIMLGVIGSMYGGFASPTDAAAVGVLLSLVLSKAYGSLTWKSFREGLTAATLTSCMIAFILAAAAFLTTSMGYTGIPRALAQWIGDLGLNTYWLLVALTLFFMLLGCFLDGISVVMLTTAVLLPIIETAGIDKIWFGIYLVVVVEMSLITPPVGFNLFVLQGMTGKNIISLSASALPFFFLMLLCIVLLVLFPGLATWLPTWVMQ